MADFAATHRPLFEGLLEAGEELRGICAAAQQSTFRGRAVAVAVTDRRLLIQPLDRRGRPSGEATSVRPGEIESAGPGDGAAITPGAAIVRGRAATLVLRTTNGERLKLSMMHGGGLFGRLGGGESQRQGVEALAEWLGRLDPGV